MITTGRTVSRPSGSILLQMSRTDYVFFTNDIYLKMLELQHVDKLNRNKQKTEKCAGRHV